MKVDIPVECIAESMPYSEIPKLLVLLHKRLGKIQNLSTVLPSHVERLLIKGHKVKAVKTLRELWGLSLKDAYEICTEYERLYNKCLHGEN